VYCIRAVVVNQDTTSLRVTTHLDDSDISEPRMVRQPVSISVREPVRFPYTATVTATEAAIPQARRERCRYASSRAARSGWAAARSATDGVLVEILGVRLDGLRLDEIADAPSVTHDQRG